MSKSTPPAAVEHPWSKSVDHVADALDVSVDAGVADSEVESRRERYGENILEQRKKRSVWDILLAQVANIIVILLAVAAAISFAFGQIPEGIAIIIAISINIIIGFGTEYQATRSMEALFALSRTSAKVRRDGQVAEVDSAELVVGDLVELEAGDMIPADVRITENNRLSIEEAALTGESEPVAKQTDPVDEEAPLAERACMAYKGTAVTAGSGVGLVTAVGMGTELGRISAMAEEAEKEESPLERRLEKLGYRLIWFMAVVLVVVFVIGWITGEKLFLLIETSIALAVAAIPEGLPIVATIALARGMWRLARRNALINRLSAVETLGSATLICTDKTGTLTENKMRAAAYLLPDEDGRREIDLRENDTFDLNDVALAMAVRIGALCTNASLGQDKQSEHDDVGDPLELALLEAARDAGMDRAELLEELPEEREEAFDPDTNMMATVHKNGEAYFVAVKGAPEAVLEAATHIWNNDGGRELTEQERDKWRQANTDMAAEGLRLLGVACKRAESPDEDPYADLALVGLVGLADPPREDVKTAIHLCHDAGIRVVMITGDQAPTAAAIARQVGISQQGHEPKTAHGKDIGDVSEQSEERRKDMAQVNIFSRVSPEQKLDIIDLFQTEGHIVAMTGDGVNDAPALKKADIGVAMGQRGTQVAREASDVILKDDKFETITAAVEQGRVIFTNIRKFIIFLLSGNAGQLIIVGAAMILGWGLTIRPLQILYLNMLGDVFPALALSVGPGDPHVMNHPPRDPREPIMTRRHWTIMFVYAIIIAVCALSARYVSEVYLGLTGDGLVSVTFLTLAFARMWHTFNMRTADSGFFVNDVTRNPFAWGAVVLCIGLLAAAVYVPVLAGALKLIQPSFEVWTVILGFSLIPLVVGQLFVAPRQGV
jgi:Ca2+-transporting ATPase